MSALHYNITVMYHAHLWVTGVGAHVRVLQAAATQSEGAEGNPARCPALNAMLRQGRQEAPHVRALDQRELLQRRLLPNQSFSSKASYIL